MADRGRSDDALDGLRVADTIAKVTRRIQARLPGVGLAETASSLHLLALSATADVGALGRPNWMVRAGLGAVAASALIAAAMAWQSMGPSWHLSRDVPALLGLLEAGANLIVMAGGLGWSLLALEGQIKRRQALKSLHRLRSLIHVIDMRQLTKDPSMLGQQATAESPTRPMNRFQLERYLDYCSELLALSAKVAALYAQGLDDGQVREAASDIEQLATNLAQKIWQKIAILELGVHDVMAADTPEAS